MEISISLRPSWVALWTGVPLAAGSAALLILHGYPVVAFLLILAAVLDAGLHCRRMKRLPAALFLQGNRWWVVSAEGELQGPWRLSGRSRRGSLWLSMRWEWGGRRYCLWLQRDMVAREDWSVLHWQMLLQGFRLQRARRLRGSVWSRLSRWRLRGNPA